MKTVQEIVREVKNPADEWRNRRLNKMAPGKAQQIILDALGIEAECHAHANQIFKALGITVIAVRQGRRSIPIVHMASLEGGGLNREGEGEYWNLTPDVDLSAIKEWMAL
jgi:hypothetical protein